MSGTGTLRLKAPIELPPALAERLEIERQRQAAGRPAKAPPAPGSPSAPPPPPKAPRAPHGAATDQAARERRRARTAALPKVERLLLDLAPDAFCHPKRPLAIGITRDVLALTAGEAPRCVLKAFMSRWTSATGYLRALAADGAFRVDLAGHAVGEVSAEHREHARARLEARGIEP